MVNCSVCGVRIGHAYENGGHFEADRTFLGGKITDTCEGCALLLSMAISSAANKIWTKVQKRKEKERKALAKAAADVRASMSDKDWEVVEAARMKREP